MLLDKMNDEYFNEWISLEVKALEKKPRSNNIILIKKDPEKEKAEIFNNIDKNIVRTLIAN